MFREARQTDISTNESSTLQRFDYYAVLTEDHEAYRPHKQDAGRFTAARCDMGLPLILRADRATAAEARCELKLRLSAVHASFWKGAKHLETRS